MHICFLSAMHPPFDKRVFDKEAVSLVAAGFTVTHLAPDDGDGLRETEQAGVRIITYPRPHGIRGRLLQLWNLYRMAARLDADCYHCNEVDSWLVGVALRLGRGKRCVFDVHEHYPSTFAETRFPPFLRPAVAACLRGLFRALLPFTDRVVLAKRTVSADYPCDGDRKILVCNYTPLAALQRQKTPDSASAQGPAGSLRLIHLGLISRVRGWPTLVEALAHTRNPGITLHVVGEFNDGSFNDFTRRVRELKLEDRVTVETWLPFDQAFQRILNSDVGLVLFQPGIQNHVYAMPHKMFDYMMGRLSVIVPDFAEEVAPIVREADCGLTVDPTDPHAVAAAFDRLAEDPDLRARHGENGYHAVLRTYNWEAEAAKLVTMYQNLASPT